MISTLPRRIDEFKALCERCAAVQEEVLYDILAGARDSEIGRYYDFAAIDGVEAFRTRLPTTTWKDYRDYAERLQQGAGDLLFPGRPPYFICTSGTTGRQKIVPESEAGRELKSLTSRLRLEAIQACCPTALESKLLPLVNHAVEGYTEAGIPYGSASGIMLAAAPEEIRRKVAFPLALLDLDYGEVGDYLLMRFAVAEDVRAILGNNAGRLAQLFEVAQEHADRLITGIEQGRLEAPSGLPAELEQRLESGLRPDPERAAELRRARERLGSFRPGAYWPELKVVACWLAGSVGRYLESLRPWLDDDVVFFDVGYGATEGKFNIPLDPGRPAGPLAVYAGFYEFREVDSGRLRLAHELEPGRSYELLVTNYAGLYRYEMGDIIRVEGFIGSTPEIVFVQKSGEQLNLCGEKVAAAALMPLVDEAAAGICGQPARYWCVVPDENEKRYVFYIETVTACSDPEAAAGRLAVRLEELLRENTLIYPVFRDQKMLRHLEVVMMRPGWQEELYRQKTGPHSSRAQVKLPLVAAGVPAPEFMA
jgi:hypothetical protein